VLEPQTAEAAIGSHTTITKAMQGVMDEFEPIKNQFDGDDGTTYRLGSISDVPLTS
jgi:hypothetical protein